MMTTTNIDLGSFVIEVANVETLTLAVTTAETLSEGLILSRNTTTGNGGLYARDGSTGLDVPKYILMSDNVVSAADVTAGTKNVRVMQGGKVREDRISTYAADTINYLEIDGLKDNSILVQSNTDLSVLDNQ